MDQNLDQHMVSYTAFESVCGRLERSNRRMFILCVVLIIALIASNVAWIVYEKQFEDVVVTQEVEQDTDGEGENTFIGGDYNGSGEE